MKKIFILKSLGLICLLFVLTACIPGDGTHSVEKKAGFFWGYWHGLIAPISLILSYFKQHLSIYEIHNNGFWYNLAYYIAILSGFGSLRLFRNQHNHKD